MAHTPMSLLIQQGVFGFFLMFFSFCIVFLLHVFDLKKKKLKC